MPGGQRCCNWARHNAFVARTARRQSTARVLTLRELNRTTLGRQLLLERSDLTVTQALERLVGMQAQAARAPYVGLWTRLRHFQRNDLAAEIERRAVVKATLHRGTLHLLTTRDYLAFRGTFQSVLTSALDEILKLRGAAVDVERLVAVVREFMEPQPRSFAEITTLLTGLLPDVDPGAMRYAVRTHLPLVQVPVDTRWSFPGNPRFTPAATWLGTAIPDAQATGDGQRPELVRRFLAGFGPASVNDMQTWSYLAKLAPAFDQARPGLVAYQDERGRALYDLADPDGALVPADAPAPVRFLPEFDNLLLAHQDRARVVPPATRSRVYLPGLRVAATVLIDGFVGATWTTSVTRKEATLLVTPFQPLSSPARAAIEAEGAALLEFVEPEARSFGVRFAD